MHEFRPKLLAYDPLLTCVGGDPASACSSQLAQVVSSGELHEWPEDTLCNRPNRGRLRGVANRRVELQGRGRLIRTCERQHVSELQHSARPMIEPLQPDLTFKAQCPVVWQISHQLVK